ncbi:hypothetical protein IIA15_07835 [candidate division TA06 bacterium]|nr:hypothetical protein [candidate division TA06 bacterium]
MNHVPPITVAPQKECGALRRLDEPPVQSHAVRGVKPDIFDREIPLFVPTVTLPF